MLRTKGIEYADAGTSGGVWGLERGYCLMVGCEDKVFAHLEPIFKTLAPGTGNVEPTPGRPTAGRTAHLGYMHCGPNGAGHFVKMVHNGIEYGIMQAYGEGFDIMRNANSKELPEDHRYTLDLGEIAELWRRGSVVSSWLLDLSAIALAQDPNLESYTGYVQDSGEGRRKYWLRRSTYVSGRGTTTRLRRRCFPRCGNSSAGISRGCPRVVRRTELKWLL
jgi:6-phosphogluconate dehydrogenase